MMRPPHRVFIGVLPLLRQQDRPARALSDMKHYAGERVDGGDGAAADDAALAQPGLIPRDPAREIALKRLLTSAAVNMNRSS